MPKLKNVLNTGLHVGVIHFDPGEVKDLDLNSAMVERALEDGHLQVLEVRRESEEVSPEPAPHPEPEPAPQPEEPQEGKDFRQG